MSDSLDCLIAAQDALIVALDRGDVGGIEAATRNLAATLPAVRSAQPDERLGHAQKQAEAARLRVNFLADRTSQKLARIAVLRGEPRVGLYLARPKTGARARLA